jgi:hypothetical protein
MQQAGEMQKKFAEVQEEAKTKEVQASAGGGMVNVTVNGVGQLVSIQIEPQAVDPRDVPMLQELIKAAVNEGVRKSRSVMKEELSKLTGGLPFPIPGFETTE